MSPDLLALLAADDEAKQLVADTERRLRERLEAARLRREEDDTRLQQQRVREIDQLVRSIEDEARGHAMERQGARDRVRQARALSSESAFKAGIDVYLKIVGGDSVPEREP